MWVFEFCKKHIYIVIKSLNDSVTWHTKVAFHGNYQSRRATSWVNQNSSFWIYWPLGQSKWECEQPESISFRSMDSLQDPLSLAAKVLNRTESVLSLKAEKEMMSEPSGALSKQVLNPIRLLSRCLNRSGLFESPFKVHSKKLLI